MCSVHMHTNASTLSAHANMSTNCITANVHGQYWHEKSKFAYSNRVPQGMGVKQLFRCM